MTQRSQDDRSNSQPTKRCHLRLEPRPETRAEKKEAAVSKHSPRIIKAGMWIWSALWIAIPAGAQKSDPPPTFQGSAYFMLGESFVDLDGLNASLKGQGHSGFSGGMFTSGGGGHIIIGKLVLGLEGQALRAKNSSGERFKTSLSAACGFFDVGYVLYSARSLSVYPLCGLGAGKINLTFAEKAPPPFEDIIRNPGRGTRLSTSGFLLNLGLGADWFIGLGGDAKNEGGLLIGIRAGYTLAPVKSGWELEKIEIVGGPRVGISGPYFRVLVGGGGKSR